MTTAEESQAFVLAPDGSRRPITATEILPAAVRGEVVLVPGALQRLGQHRELANLIFGTIDDVCSVGHGNECRRLGLERLHDVLDGAQMERAVYEACTRLAQRYAPLMKAIVPRALGFQRPFYIHRSSLVRFLPPLGVAERDPERFFFRGNVGRLGGHGAHRDHWFGFPLNSINVWMGIGRVARENGLAIYTEAWEKPCQRDGDYIPEDGLGAPVYIACDPGDLLVFHSRQVHATVPNVTDSTRVVMSGRFCLEPPITLSIEGLNTPSCYSPLVGTRLEPFAQPAARLNRVYIVEWLKKKTVGAVGRVERKVGGAPLRLAGRVARRALRYRRGDPYLHA